jgi:hypothetical protein
MKFSVKPIESCADIVEFPVAFVMLAFAQAGSAEIEAQHREPETVERLHGMEDYFVVQGSTEHRMRMANHCGVSSVWRAYVEQGFEASGRAVEKERADGSGVGVHAGRTIRITGSNMAMGAAPVVPLRTAEAVSQPEFRDA